MSRSLYEASTCRRRFLKLLGAGIVINMSVSRAGHAGGVCDGAAVRTMSKQRARNEVTLQTAAELRDLWIGHIFWVRTVSLAVIDGDDAAMEAAEQQAIANAQSIAASIEPFYGAAAGKAFFELLVENYRAVKTYLAATVSNNLPVQAVAMQSLVSNAEETAMFLNRANPYLPKDELRSLLLAHNGHHIQQIQELVARNFMAEAKTWETMKTHIYQIADSTADALMEQFPERFPSRRSK